MLEMERTQYKLMLESLQQRHQADMVHLESTYRYQALTSAPLFCQVLACSLISLPRLGMLGHFPDLSLGRAGTKPC